MRTLLSSPRKAELPRKAESPRKAERIAALVARATALIEQVDRAAAKASPQKRAQLEIEVAVLKGLLAKIGYHGTA